MIPKRYQLINVSPLFARVIKTNSAIEGKSIIQYTEELGKQLEQKFEQQQKPKRSFDLRI